MGGAAKSKKAPGRAKAPEAAAAPPPPVLVPRPAFSDEWLADVARPRTLTVFGQDWSVKAPTGHLAVSWEMAMQTQGIGTALALMMADTTPSQEGAAPGSAAAVQFIAMAARSVPIDQAQEFWLRIEAALFPGEAQAS